MSILCPLNVNIPCKILIKFKNKKDKGLFKKRFYEHTIVRQDELNNHINYIHYNPVKHVHVKCVKDWKYSSFHKFVKNNLYDKNWGNLNDTENI